MPVKYHIHIRQVPPRFSPPGKSTVMDWNEGCLRCAKCVKEVCPVDAYRKRGFDRTQFADTIDSMCRDCYRCVQGCPKELIFKAMNPQYRQLGDAYWTPEIIATTWNQAETGKIPVSGAGYGGVFAGEGFDSCWTDMSEIVRPTRDGIHGREYISTTVDLGRKPMFLAFDDQGEMQVTPTTLMEIPLPVILGEPAVSADPARLRLIMAAAAQDLGTLAVLPRKSIGEDLMPAAHRLVPILPADFKHWDDPLLAQVPAVEIPDHPGVVAEMEAIKQRYPGLLVWIRVPADSQAPERVSALAAAGAEVLHLAGSDHARGVGDAAETHLKDMIRRCHLKLVEDRLRDAVTLLAGGGIALAEHVAKAIVCGADAILADTALLLSLECRLCKECQDDNPCPIDLGNLNVKRGAQRMVNLVGAWNNQLLEVMGAMGMREVRRLRGEVGRIMFKEDLDKEIFAPLFSRPEGESRRVGE